MVSAWWEARYPKGKGSQNQKVGFRMIFESLAKSDRVAIVCALAVDARFVASKISNHLHVEVSGLIGGHFGVARQK